MNFCRQQAGWLDAWCRLICLLSLLAVVFGQSVAAQPVVPDVAQIQQRIDALPQTQPDEAIRSRQKAALEKALQQRNAYDQVQQQLTELQYQVEQAPLQIRQLHETQEALEQQTQPPALPDSNDIAALEQQLQQANAQLMDWQLALMTGSADGAATSLAVQEDLSALMARLQKVSQQVKTGPVQGHAAEDNDNLVLLVEQALLEAQIQLLRQKASANNVLSELAALRRSVLTRQITQQEQWVQQLQTHINQLREQRSAQMVAQQLADSDTTGADDDVLVRQQQINVKISDYLLRTTNRLNQLTQQNLRNKQQLDGLGRISQTLNEQIAQLDNSMLLSSLLYQQQQAMPQLRIDKYLADEVSAIREYQVSLRQYQEQLKSPKSFIASLLAEVPVVTEQLTQGLAAIVDARVQLLAQLEKELNTLLNEAIAAQLLQTQLLTLHNAISTQMQEKMFWIPSHSRINWRWLKEAPAKLMKQVSGISWFDLLRDLYSALLERPWLFIPLAVAIAGLLWKRSALEQRLDVIHHNVLRLRTDSHWNTPGAILIYLLLALPVSLALWLAGVSLRQDGQGQNVFIGSALNNMALAWLFFYTCWKMLNSQGVAGRHFRMSEPLIRFLRRQTPQLGTLVMILLFVVSIASHQLDLLTDDVLGVLCVLIVYILMTTVLYRLIFRLPGTAHFSVPYLLFGSLLVCLPMGLFAAVCAGYYYTALRLSNSLIHTLYIVIIWMALQAALMRGLAIATRRLAIQREQARRAASAENDDTAAEVEEPVLDMNAVNQQSRRLVRLGLLVALFVAVYAVWADLLGVVGYLDTFILYQQGVGTDGSGGVSISLFDLLRAVVFATFAFALATNLPGLLEMLILSRLNLTPSGIYAVTTLLAYTISGIGVMLVLAALGLSWDKLQWLVAALSVGIGFGMQAIFANFVSGLIMLFERPVRIGDLITIGGVTGTVNRIRIRATHITDGDNKTVIIPNQQFLTSQLTNWTLQDQVTRIVLNYNILRAEDIGLAKRLMLQAVRENPRVMKEPAPAVVLVNYGTITLDHELRFYVPSLSDRSAAIDEVNARVDQLFRDNKVNIASRPRMDVTLIEHKILPTD